MKRVLDIGQCAADAWAIRRVIEGEFPAEVIAAGTLTQAVAALRNGDFDLVLVNRILDADGSAGLDVIRQIKNDPALGGVPVMLVSNFEDAQRNAVALGALPGFGKSTLGRPAMLDRLRALLKPA
jgi:two-component system chemotaxis response regulator CheY